MSNVHPKVGPVVINEIMYHPVSGGSATELANEEFVESRNTTATNVPLFDPLHPANGWKLDGGGTFNFNSNHTIGATGALTLVAFDPVAKAAALASFRAKYATNGPVAGPYSGRLNYAGESVELYTPTLRADVVSNCVAQAPSAGLANGGGGGIPPTISGQPQCLIVTQGTTANFSVTARAPRRSAPARSSSRFWAGATATIPWSSRPISAAGRTSPISPHPERPAGGRHGRWGEQRHLAFLPRAVESVRIRIATRMLLLWKLNEGNVTVAYSQNPKTGSLRALNLICDINYFFAWQPCLSWRRH